MRTVDESVCPVGESMEVVVPAELSFSTRDLAQVRFAVSPMWEVGPSLRLLASGHTHPVHRGWAEQVRPRIARTGLDIGTLTELVPPSGYVPDFLNPAPAGAAPTLDEELTAIAATPARRLRTELDRLADEHAGGGGHAGLGPRSRALYADPAAGLARLTEEIAAYWDLALAPYWARLRAVLDADVLHRARQSAEYGTGRLFGELHPSMSWGGDVLRLALRRRALPRGAAGAGLVLIPSCFAGPGPYMRTSPPELPQLAYPARGIGALWQSRPVSPAGPLSAVLGRSRALLLTELEAPASTTELAARTGLSRSAVSQYLTALRDARLVSAHRAGRWVLYARTALAEALLEG